VLDLREGEKYIANSPVALPRRRQTASRSCISSTSRFSSFDLIRLSEREAADRHTRKFSRTGILAAPLYTMRGRFFVGNCKLTTTGRGLSEAQLLAAGSPRNMIRHSELLKVDVNAMIKKIMNELARSQQLTRRQPPAGSRKFAVSPAGSHKLQLIRH